MDAGIAVMFLQILYNNKYMMIYTYILSHIFGKNISINALTEIKMWLLDKVA